MLHSQRRYIEAFAVLAVIVTVDAIWREERVTFENFDRIEVGMTRDDVRRRIGHRPADRQFERARIVDGGRFDWAARLPRGAPLPEEFREFSVETWEAPGLSIVVVFDDRGRVASRMTGVGQSRPHWWYRLWSTARKSLARIF